jgi:FSR family fosmidomycin resistance protein-like MFS transporter
MSFFITGGNLGYALGPLLAGVIVASMGIHGLVVLMLPALAMAAVLRYAYPLDRGACAPQTPREIRPGGGRSAILPIGILVMGAALRAWAIFASIAYLPTYLIGRGYDLAPANFLVTLMLLAGVVGQISGGILSDRYGRKEITILGMLGAIPAFLLFMQTDGLLSLSILMLFGFLLWSSFSITVAIAQELMPGNIGLASGLTLGLAVGGGGIGVAITGALADSFALDAALLTLVVPVALSIFLFAVLPYPWRILPRHGTLRKQ